MFRWLLLPLLALTVHAQVYEGKTLVSPSLVADTTAIVPGQPFQVGLLLDMAPHWHTYWSYAGDAGFPTSITWTLPEGFVAGPIEWPLPKRFKEPGDIEVYAYGDQVLLLTTLVAPKGFSEKSATLSANTSWLVCEEICIPGSAELEITLPVSNAAKPYHADLFAKFRSQLPSLDPPPFELSWTTDGPATILTVTGLTNVTAVDLFPLPTAEQQVNHPVNSPVTDGTATISMKASGDLRGILVVETPEGRQGWMVSSNPADASASPAPKPAASPTPTAAPPAVAPLGLGLAILYGLLGGLILNVMPCVLPVISLKIFGFIRQAGDHPARILRHGLAFVGGIFAFFLSLAVIIIALKAGGTEVTWAFQFQNPWFNVVLGSLVFVFALNLFGVFEIVLPGQASNALSEASSHEGYAGSFSQGLFATLLATPCTAPFLGSALGFAFSQSAFTILVIFAAIATGMGAPYLLLSAQPAWMKILPKPGAWMERVKQFMGFPLIATLLWMLSVLGAQKGLYGVLWFGCFLLALALSCWIYGAFCGPLSGRTTRIVALTIAAAIAVGGGWIFLGEKFTPSEAAPKRATDPASPDALAWQEFSQAALEKLRAEGTPVFLDFTADWCLSCKYNERTAIDVPSVRAAFKESGIVPMKADWTNDNPEITAALKAFGRVGVPFYVLYPANHGEPVVLPELLTSQIVLDALAKAR